MFRNITIADIKKQTPVIIIGEPTLKEAATKYIEQTEYALFTLPKKMTDCSEQKIRQFCSIVFQVKHACMHAFYLPHENCIFVESYNTSQRDYKLQHPEWEVL